jgi:hypothetical protein
VPRHVQHFLPTKVDIRVDSDSEYEWDGDPEDDGYQESIDGVCDVRFKRKRKQSQRSKHRLWACKHSSDSDLGELIKKACVWSGPAVTLVCFHEPIRRDNIFRYATLQELCCLETITRRNPYSWHADAAELLGLLALTAPESIHVSEYLRAIAAPLGQGEEFQPNLFKKDVPTADAGPLLLERWLELARNVRSVVPQHQNERPAKRLSVRKMDPAQKRQYWAARKRIQREKQKADMLDIEEQGVDTDHLDGLAESGYCSDDFDQLTEEAVHYLRRVFGYKFKDFA